MPANATIDDPSQVQGLPPGATLKPIAQSGVDDPSQIEGLPAGATLKPIGSDTSTPAPAEDTGMWASLKRNTYGAASAMYHAFRDPATPEEKAEIARKIAEQNIQNHTLDPKDPNHIPNDQAINPSTATLAYHRLIDAPADELNAKANNELAAANDLYNNQHKWAGVGASMSGAVDKILAAVPGAGPLINQISERWENGDHIGALTDIATLVAAEKLAAKVSGEPAPQPGYANKMGNAIGRATGAVGSSISDMVDRGAQAVKDRLPNPSNWKPTNPFRQIIQGAKVAQGPADTAIRGGVESGAPNPQVASNIAGTALKDNGATVMDETLQVLANQKAQAYKTVDTTAGFDVKELKDSVKSDQYKLRQLGNTPEDVAQKAKLQASITDATNRLTAAEAKLTAAGIDPQLADKANQKWQAAKDFKKVLVRSVGPDGNIDINKLFRQSDALRYTKYGDRLTQLMGKDGSVAFMKQLQSARDLGVHAMTVQRVAKFIGYVVGANELLHGTGLVHDATQSLPVGP